MTGSNATSLNASSKKVFHAPMIVEFGDIAGITATGCTIPGSDVMGGSVGHSKNPGKGKGSCN